MKFNLNKLSSIIFLLTLIILFSSCYNTSSSHLTRVFVVIPKDYDGKITILFNESGYPEMPKSNGLYFPKIDSKNIYYTSTSFSKADSVNFFLYRIDLKGDYFIDTTANFTNYSYFYNKEPKSEFCSIYKNKEFYVGYFYNVNNKSSQDSLDNFINVIRRDTLGQ